MTSLFPVTASEAELASRLRLAVTRLARRLRTERGDHPDQPLHRLSVGAARLDQLRADDDVHVPRRRVEREHRLGPAEQ